MNLAIQLISSLLCILIMLVVSRVFGLEGIAITFLTLLAIHVWYRRRYGRWME